MPYAYKILGQSYRTTTAEGDLYTVPSATSAIASSVVVANQTTAPVTFRLSVAIAGATAASAQYLFYDITIDPNDTHYYDLGITLAATDKVRVTAGTANALSFNLFGTEVT